MSPNTDLSSGVMSGWIVNLYVFSLIRMVYVFSSLYDRMCADFLSVLLLLFLGGFKCTQFLIDLMVTEQLMEICHSLKHFIVIVFISHNNIPFLGIINMCIMKCESKIMQNREIVAWALKWL